MEKSSDNHLRVIMAIIATVCAVFVIFLFINSIPPCSIYDFGLHLKGCVHRLETSDTAYSLEYTYDGRVLMSSGYPYGPIYLWSMPDAKPIHIFENANENPQQVGTISPNGKMIAIYSDANQNITVFDAQSLNPLEVVEQSLGGHMRFSPRDPLLAYVGVDERIHLWNITDHKDTPIEDSTYPTALSISPKGDILALVAMLDEDKVQSYGDDEVQLYSLPDGRLLRTIKLDNNVDAFVFTSDGKSLVTLSFGDNGSVVTFWNIANGKPERLLRLPKLGVNILALSPDNTRIAVGQKNCADFEWAGGPSDDRCLTIWDTTTGKMVRRIPLRTRIIALAFSPDGRHLAIAVEEAIYIWENP